MLSSEDKLTKGSSSFFEQALRIKTANKLDNNCFLFIVFGFNNYLDLIKKVDKYPILGQSWSILTYRIN